MIIAAKSHPAPPSDFQVKSCKAQLAHTEEDLLEAMQRDKKELRDKIESESGDVKRKMELECNEMRDRLQGGAVQ